MTINFTQPPPSDLPPHRPLRKAAAIIAFGLAIAALQALRISPVSSSGLITGWAGPWLVFSLIAFAILWLRYRRSAPGFAAVTAAVIFSLGLNTCVFNSAAERQRLSEFSTKSKPIFDAFARGEFPTDEQIKAANVGSEEPQLLLLAGLRRDLGQLVVAYEKTWSELDLYEMVAADQLASASARAASRARLDDHATLHNTFRVQFAAAFDDGYTRLYRSFGGRTPAPGKLNALQQKVAPIREITLAIADARREQQDLVVEVLNLLDAKPRGIRLAAGDPPGIAFPDHSLSKPYADLAQRLDDAGRRHDALIADLQVRQAKFVEELDQVLREQQEGR